MHKHRRLVLVVLALLVALGIRVSLFQGRTRYGPPLGFVGDEPDYMARAANLAEHGLYSRGRVPPLLPDASRPPGFPALLALVYQTGPLDLHRGLLAVMLLNLAAVALLALGIGRYFGRTTAAVAAVLLAFDLNHAVAGVELLSESLCSLLVVGATMLQLAAWRAPQPSALFLLSGIVWGMAALVHSVVLLAPVLLVLANVVQSLPSWKRGLAAAAICLAGFGVVTAPWVARNYVVFRAPTISLKAGEQLLLWYGAVVESDIRGTDFETAHQILLREVRPKLGRNDRWQAYNDAVLRREGMRYLRERPYLFVVACARGFAGFFFAPNRQRVQRYLPHDGPWRLVWAPNALGWLGLMALAGLGAVTAYRRWPSLTLLLCGTVLSVALLTGPLGYGRFRVSVDPLLCLLAAIGLRHVWQAIWCSPRRLPWPSAVSLVRNPSTGCANSAQAAE